MANLYSRKISIHYKTFTLNQKDQKPGKNERMIPFGEWYL